MVIRGVFAAFMLASWLSGCGSLPMVAPADVRPASPCAAPVEVPVKVLTAREVGFYWTADRQSLVECGEKNGVVE